MRLTEFTSPTKTPEQLRVDALKAAKDKAAKALADERKRQQVVKTQKRLIALQTPNMPKL